jgi:lysozyme family protein
VVKPFYKAMYWDKIKGDQLPAGVDYAAYDLAVNSGVGRAAKYLQQIAGVTVDGVLGPKSMGAIRECDPEQTVDALCDMRLDFLKRLPTFDTFGKGWSIRVADVKAKAADMA